MSRLPRGLSSRELVQALKLLGYEITRQTGSHMRLTTSQRGQHHLTVPNHDELSIGVVSVIVGEVAKHFRMSPKSVRRRLFG
jgi:predicted RNA binding protein YcfA (HicA-like mRNA interferase family)